MINAYNPVGTINAEASICTQSFASPFVISMHTNNWTMTKPDNKRYALMHIHQ